MGTRHVSYGCYMDSIIIIKLLKLMVLISFDSLAGEYLVEVSRENIYMDLSLSYLYVYLIFFFLSNCFACILV